MHTLRSIKHPTYRFWRDNLEDNKMHIWLGGHDIETVAGYALDSPEWLDLFVNEVSGTQYSMRTHPNVDVKIKQFARECHMDPGNSDFLKEFHEIYDQYGVIQPVVFKCQLSKPTKEQAENDVEKILNFHQQNPHLGDPYLNTLYYMINIGSFPVKSTISPENLTSIFLPTDIFDRNFC